MATLKGGIGWKVGMGERSRGSVRAWDCTVCLGCEHFYGFIEMWG